MKHPTNNSVVIPAPRWAGIIPVCALLFAFLSAIVLSGSTVSAQDAAATPEPEIIMPELGIRPVDSDGIFFTETIKPGETIKRSVELINAGKIDVDALTYAADTYSMVNGGMGVELADKEASGTTLWVEYERERFELKHGEGRIREFTVTVPKETEPGQYLTSLVIQTADPVEGTGGVTFNQILRQAIAIAITVPGEEHPSLELGATSYKDTQVSDSILVEVRNTGNIHLKPSGSLQIVDAAGAVVLDTAVAMESVYAGTKTLLETGLVEPLAPGDYTATVHLEDAKSGVSAAAESAPFTVVASVDPAAVSSITVDGFGVELIKAADGTVQLANVSVEIGNSAGRLTNAQIVLHVELDGELVEDYPLATGLALEGGTTNFQQRYLPLTGWTSGSYSFSVTIETVDPASGNVTVLATSAEPVVHDVS